MSRTDKDRPYIVKRYDKTYRKSKKHRVTDEHGCEDPNRGIVCDFGKFTVKEVKSMYHSLNFLYVTKSRRPRCEPLLWEDRNRKTDRWRKKHNSRVKRRGWSQWNSESRYFQDNEDYFANSWHYGKWAHRDD